VIDPAKTWHQRGDEETDDETIAAFRKRLSEAEPFLIVTPEYNHGYSAPLKFLIDSAYQEWQAKPVGIRLLWRDFRRFARRRTASTGVRRTACVDAP